jgi:hypothetical protein
MNYAYGLENDLHTQLIPSGNPYQGMSRPKINIYLTPHNQIEGKTASAPGYGGVNVPLYCGENSVQLHIDIRLEVLQRTLI